MEERELPEWTDVYGGRGLGNETATQRKVVKGRDEKDKNKEEKIRKKTGAFALKATHLRFTIKKNNQNNFL